MLGKMEGREGTNNKRMRVDLDGMLTQCDKVWKQSSGGEMDREATTSFPDPWSLKGQGTTSDWTELTQSVSFTHPFSWPHPQSVLTSDCSCYSLILRWASTSFLPSFWAGILW